MNDRPSLFDQLTPTDALSDDFAWIDSLWEESNHPLKPPRKRRPRKPAETVSSDPANGSYRPSGPQASKPEPEHGTESTAPTPIVPDDEERPAPPNRPADPARSGPGDSPATVASMPADSPVSADGDPMTPLDSPDASDRPTRAHAVAATWAKRMLIAAGTVVLLAAVVASAGSHARTVRRQDALERVETSMNDLNLATRKAKKVLATAAKHDLDESESAVTLRKRIDSNAQLERSKRAGLTVDESDRLASKADRASRRTRNLTGKVSRLVRDKPLRDAKRRMSEALGKAREAARDASPSDDASRKALDELNALIGKAGKLGGKATAGRWSSMASELDQARDRLAKALEAKAKADEEQRRQQEQQEQQQDAAPSPQYQGSHGSAGGGSAGGGSSGAGSSGGGNAGGSTGSPPSGGGDGWYVPPETGGGDGLPGNDSSI